jgi:solute carrier family 4 anion exchanger 2/solute carrier family 4 anion exchanger 3
MHLYTVIQLLVIGLLWGLKLSPASMVYPLVIVFLIPLKWLLSKFVFTKQEMEAVSVVLKTYGDLF